MGVWKYIDADSRIPYCRDGSERGDGYLNVAGIMDKILKMIMAVTEAKA